MFRLRTLGVLDLCDSSQRELRAVLQQPKRLGLLAYLAIAAGRRFVRRDVLLGLFWPDLDQEHARAALRRALYFLRKAMGADVLEGRGDEEVGVREGTLWCDAVAFEEHLSRGESEAALALYQGPLLEGFYIAGAPEAESWLDLTRAHLTERAAQAAWALAEASGTPPAIAAEWARRAALLTPDDEDAIQRQLLLLDRIGDRPAALRAFDEHARRRRLDLEIEPSPALAKLAHAIRTRAPDVPAPPAPGTPAGLLAVLPFTVHGDVALGYLREGLVDLLSTAMDGFGDFRTVDPRALLAAAHAQPNPKDDAAGFELAGRFGATHVLQGGVVSAGGKLRIAATIRDLAGGVLSRTEVEGEGEGALFTLVDKMVRKLLVRGGSAPGERLSRLAGLTTVPLPALRAWLEGEQEFRLGRYLPALEAYQRAAALDGTFALAHYRVAGAAAANAMIAPARQASGAAMRYHQRLSERDRLLVEAQHSWLHGRADDAERRYAAVVAAHPDDLDAWFGLGDLLLHSNPYRGRSSREARTPLERAAALDPQHVSALAKLARLAALEERHGDLEVLVDRILAKSPDHDQVLPMRALRAFLRDDPTEQAEIISQLAGARALTLGITFSDVTVYSRRLAPAERLGRALAGVARSDELRALVHLILAQLAAADGRLQDASLELAAAERLDPAWGLEVRAHMAALPFLEWPESFIQESREALERWNPESVAPNVSLPLAFHNGLHPHLRAYLLGMLAARMGDGSAAAEASELLAELTVEDESEGLVERLERAVDSAVHQLRGDPERALTDLSGARNNVWFQLAVASPFYAGTLERWRRAELLQALGRVEEAKGWFTSLAERSPWEVVFRGPAERRLAVMER